jgi:prepilin peptidase CpaA
MAGAFSFIRVAAKGMTIFVGLCETAMLGLLIWGAREDIVAFRLPNWLTLATAVVAAALVAMTVSAPMDFLWHLGFGLAVFVIGLILFQFNLLGGGDVKWVAALAIWIGPNLHFMQFIFLMGIVGGLVAGAILLINRRWPHYGREDGRRRMPYGVAIAVAGMEYWLRHGVLSQDIGVWF